MKNDQFYILVNKEKPQDYINKTNSSPASPNSSKINNKKFTLSQQKNKCIGCGYCANYSPKCWKMNKETGKAELVGGTEKGNLTTLEADISLLEENKKAAEACPMRIIKIN